MCMHVWAEEINRNALHFSSDGGKTWVQLAQTPHHLGALSFVDTHNGWAIDDAGLLYQTRDGGTNWQSINYSISYLLVCRGCANCAERSDLSHPDCKHHRVDCNTFPILSDILHEISKNAISYGSRSVRYIRRVN